MKKEEEGSGRKERKEEKVKKKGELGNEGSGWRVDANLITKEPRKG